jgi:hypothetical protein
MKISNNPTTEALRGVEMELASLPVGSRFQLSGTHVGDPDRGGTLVDITQGRCVVRMDDRVAPRPVTFVDRTTGISHEFLSTSHARTSSLPHETPVIPVDDDSTEGANYMARTAAATLKAVATRKANREAELAKSIAESNAANQKSMEKQAKAEQAEVPKKVSAPVAPAAQPVTDQSSPKQQVLVTRWNFAITKLSDLLRVDTASEIVKAARDRISSIYDDSVSAKVVLPAPYFTDPVFSTMDFTGLSEAPASATTTEDEDMKKKLKKAPASATARAKSAAAPKAATTPRPAKVAKALNDCGCGCGEQVKGNFRQGHDAKYRSLILQVEREEIKQSALPKGMRAKDGGRLEFKKVTDGFKCTNSLLNH